MSEPCDFVGEVTITAVPICECESTPADYKVTLHVDGLPPTEVGEIDCCEAAKAFSIRPAFTLIEMTIVIAIIAILSGMALSVYSTAALQAKGMRTRAIIAKIDQMIGEKYEGYRTRQVPIKIPNGRYPNGQPYMQPIGEPFAETAADNNLTNGFRDNSEGYTDQPFNGFANGQYDLGAADFRLLALRELQRLEMPNQIADVWQGPMVMPFGPPGIVGNPIMARPSLSKQYLRRAQQITGPALAGWTGQFEGSECLYLILACSRDGDKSALDFFSPTEIGDFDGDGMNEILDSFGQPIEFVRWPLGYSEDTVINPLAPGAVFEWGLPGVDDDGDGITDNTTEAGYGDDRSRPATPQSRNVDIAGADPFDPLRVDGRARMGNRFVLPVMLKPLVYSAGPDKKYAIMAPAAATFLADPYRVEFNPLGTNPPKLSAGSRFDPTGYEGFTDNITNHDLEAR